MADLGTMRVKSTRRDAQGRRDHGRHDRRAGSDRRGRGAVAVMAPRARPCRHPGPGRRRAHGRPGQDRRDSGGRDDPGDGQSADRPLRRGPDPRGARGRLHRRERGPYARGRDAPHRQMELHGAVRLRLPEPRRGAPPDRGRGGDDPHQGGGDGRHRQRRPAHALRSSARSAGSDRWIPTSSLPRRRSSRLRSSS